MTSNHCVCSHAILRSCTTLRRNISRPTRQDLQLRSKFSEHYSSASAKYEIFLASALRRSLVRGLNSITAMSEDGAKEWNYPKLPDNSTILQVNQTTELRWTRHLHDLISTNFLYLNDTRLDLWLVDTQSRNYMHKIRSQSYSLLCEAGVEQSKTDTFAISR